MNKDKNIFDEAIEELVERLDCETFTNYDDEFIISVLSGRVYLIEKALQLGKLYKNFFDKLKIELRNTFDIDYLYPHEFIIGYDIKSENKELVELFKKIKELESKELENENNR